MSFVIGVKTRTLPFGYQPIIDYYNEHRVEGFELEKLPRCEGGFMIKLPESQWLGVDPDLKIRQLKWCRGQLIRGWIGFDNTQLSLLFDALSHCLGENNVFKVYNESEKHTLPCRTIVSCTSKGRTVTGTY